MAYTVDNMHSMAGQAPAIRHIGPSDLWRALRLGWQDFLAAPTQLFFLALIYPIVGLVAAAVASGDSLLPMIWPLVSGFALVGPLAALGFYEISRRRENGMEVSWLDALQVRHSPAIFSILIMGVILLAIFVAWMTAARMIYGLTMGSIPNAPFDAFVRFVFNSPEGMRMIVLGNAVGFFFAALVLVLTVVSFPMLLDRDPGIGVAIRTSIRAVAANPFTMALWGLIVGTALLLGAVPFFVGLAVVVPVLGHATWHLYRAVVV
ncbi:DUF2189 domain-containing protein [Humitalea sp. 24SJ18S-53]|uniref:DUF2189 domain-containing protein n=1 Tax=Humitalea sp. 24SJ18S-53 TaxID=3422307 RepID=UPI003D6700C3